MRARASIVGGSFGLVASRTAYCIGPAARGPLAPSGPMAALGTRPWRPHVPDGWRGWSLTSRWRCSSSPGHEMTDSHNSKASAGEDVSLATHPALHPASVPLGTRGANETVPPQARGRCRACRWCHSVVSLARQTSKVTPILSEDFSTVGSVP
jgi:hypothetical protein